MNVVKQVLIGAAFLSIFWVTANAAPSTTSTTSTTSTITYSLSASEDSTLWNPDPSVEAKWQDTASRNFGAMSSRHIASAASHAPGKSPRGIFESVLRFDAGSMIDQLNTTYGQGNWSIDSISLYLMTSDNVSGPGMFNAPGTEGKFKVSYMPVDGGWKQGTGYKDAGYPGNYGADGGATYNSIHATLTDNPAMELSIFNFVKQGILKPAEYEGLGTDHPENKTSLLNALTAGDDISLLIQAADDQVAFNFTSQAYGTDPQYDPALILSITTIPEPTILMIISAGGLFLIRKK